MVLDVQINLNSIYEGIADNYTVSIDDVTDKKKLGF